MFLPPDLELHLSVEEESNCRMQRKYMRPERENTEEGGFVVAALQGCLTTVSGHSDSLLCSGSLLRNLHIIKAEFMHFNRRF